MKRDPVTASERRGIIMVAALALLITLCGWLIPRCSGKGDPMDAPDVEVLMEKDSVSKRPKGDSVKKRRKRSLQNGDSVSAGKKGSRKIYRKRSFLDEPVG